LAQTDLEADADLRAAAARAWEGYRAAMDRQHLDEALAAMIDLVRAGNGYAESQAPWLLAKAGDAERLGQVLAAMAETCRILGHLVAPFTPGAARALHGQLGVEPDTTALADAAGWGGGEQGMRVGEPAPLFPRVELPAEAAVEVPS
jgi:methionyl-tRNA synthetase